ncbi:MAG TPA: GGDEF domain-containing protein [Gaiellaceae bacterium]
MLALVNADVAVLWVRGEDGTHTFKKFYGISPSKTAVAVERELVDLVARGTALVNSSEPPLQPSLTQLSEKLGHEGSGAVCVDLQRRRDSLGILCLHRVGRGAFDAAEAADAGRFAKFAALAIFEMAERERAERDEVTGMPGRNFLLRSIDAWVAEGEPFGLACIDFDGLKAVNEEFGYEAGNKLIRAVAHEIEGLLHEGEIAGRLHGRGGDEFMCLLKERDEAELAYRCKELEAALDRAPVPSALASSYLGVSVGATLANTTTPTGALLTAAENAMRERKQERRRSQGRPASGRRPAIDDPLTLSLSSRH